MKHAPSPTPPPADALSPEQWQGLARLADLVNAASGPFAEPMTGALNRTLGLANRYDIGDLAEAVLDTAEALHASGLLALLRDNADLLAESIRSLAPLLGALSEKLNGLPLAELKSDLNRLHALMDKADLLGAYATEHFAGPAARWSVDAADFARREALGESLQDLLQTLGHLHRNGSLAWLRDISDYLEVREQRRLLGGLAGQGVSDAASLPDRARKLLQGVQSAMDDAAADADQLGGVKGLLHLLRDPEVQRGLRALAVLPTYLEGGKTP
jgi:hypothetical protein